MRILSLHIDNFGKLRDIDLDLADGINCIEAENGYGKTTIAAFIKAMLYGMPQTGKRDISENERKHYAPWHGGVFGGTLDIETEKGSYRISRTFGKKASDDSFSLIELKTKRPSSDYTERIGAELFGIDAESYEKSVFIPQYDVKIAMTADIGAKLNELLADSDDMADLDSAVERLEEYSKRFKHYRGDGGLISETKASLAKTLSDINDCDKALADAAEAESALLYIDSEIKKCDGEILELNKKLENANAAKIKYSEYETYKTYLSDIKRARERLERCVSSLGGSVPSEEELKELSLLSARIAELSVETENVDGAALLRMSERFGDSPLSDSELDSLSEKSKRARALEAEAAELTVSAEPEKPSLKRVRTFKLSAAAAAALFVIGIALCFVSLPVGIAVSAVSFAAAAFFLSFAGRASDLNRSKISEYSISLAAYRESEERRKALKAEAERLREELEAELGRFYRGCPGGIDAVIGRLYSDTESYRQLIETARAKEERERARCLALSELCLRADGVFGGFGADTSEGYSVALRKITDTVRAVESAKEDIAHRTRVAEEYASEKALSGETPEVPDVGEDEARIALLRQRADEQRSRRGIFSRKLEEFTARAEALPELLEKRERLRERAAEYEEKRDSAEKAKEYLKKAADALSSRYLRKMEKSFAGSYSFVSGDGKEPDIDSELGVSFRDGGESRDPRWYSDGIRSLMYVCMRLSLVDALFEKEKPFLIFDDPFSELDAEKMKNAAELIRRLGEEHQIVYFTCHESRRI